MLDYTQDIQTLHILLYFQMANSEISKLNDSVDDLNGKLERIAEFFCEDKQKFNVEELLSRLLKFIEQLPALAKV